MTDRSDTDRMPESSKPPEYERFEDLTRRLLKVSKADLERERRATGAPERGSAP